MKKSNFFRNRWRFNVQVEVTHDQPISLADALSHVLLMERGYRLLNTGNEYSIRMFVPTQVSKSGGLKKC